MMELAQNMHFEEAQKIKKIEVLENYQSRSLVNPKSPISMCSQLFLMKCRLCEFYKSHMVLFTYYGNKEETGKMLNY
jgi:hypothetical protein